MRLSLRTRQCQTHSGIRAECEPVRFAPKLIAKQPELGPGGLDPKDQPAALGVAHVPLLRSRTEALHASLCQPRNSRFHGHLMDTFGGDKAYGSATVCNSKDVLKCLKTQRFRRAKRCERLQLVAALNYMGCKGSRVQISALRSTFPITRKTSGGPMSGPIFPSGHVDAACRTLAAGPAPGWQNRAVPH